MTDQARIHGRGEGGRTVPTVLEKGIIPHMGPLPGKGIDPFFGWDVGTTTTTVFTDRGGYNE